MAAGDPAAWAAPIESIEAFRVSVPLPTPIYALGSLITAREFLIVRASAAGHVGIGYGLTRSADLETIVNRQIKPLCSGKSVSEIRAIWQAARDSVRMIGDVGLFARALAATDIALWDLMGKTLGVPLWRLLGGRSQTVPCLAIMGYYRPQDSVETVRSEAKILLKAGYTRFKIPFGLDADLDKQRVAALREVVGEKALIAVDASAAYDTPKQAIAAWRRIERYQPAFLEDPFPASAWPLALELARTSDIPIAFGESLASPELIQQLSDGIDVLRPDATHQMGVTGYIQGTAIAAERHIPLYPHYFPDIHAPLIGALGGWMVEESPYEADTVGFWQLRTTQPTIKDGLWHLADRPGFGIDWDVERLQQWRVSGSVAWDL